MFFVFVLYFLVGYIWVYIGILIILIILCFVFFKKRGVLIGMYNMISFLGVIVGNFFSGFLMEGLGFIVNFMVVIVFFLVLIFLFFGENVKSRKFN